MLTLKIALRFITSKKLQSIFIILGFAIGISTNVFIGNLIMAIEDDLIARTINSQSHITITSSTEGDYLQNFKPLLPLLEQQPEVKSYCKVLEGHAFIMNLNEDRPDDIVVRGISSLKTGASMFNIYNSKFEGHFPTEARKL